LCIGFRCLIWCLVRVCVFLSMHVYASVCFVFAAGWDVGMDELECIVCTLIKEKFIK